MNQQLDINTSLLDNPYINGAGSNNYINADGGISSFTFLHDVKVGGVKIFSKGEMRDGKKKGELVYFLVNPKFSKVVGKKYISFLLNRDVVESNSHFNGDSDLLNFDKLGEEVSNVVGSNKRFASESILPPTPAPTTDFSPKFNIPFKPLNFTPRPFSVKPPVDVSPTPAITTTVAPVTPAPAPVAPAATSNQTAVLVTPVSTVDPMTGTILTQAPTYAPTSAIPTNQPASGGAVSGGGSTGGDMSGGGSAAPATSSPSDDQTQTQGQGERKAATAPAPATTSSEEKIFGMKPLTAFFVFASLVGGGIYAYKKGYLKKYIG